jgi:hypothetical protein
MRRVLILAGNAVAVLVLVMLLINPSRFFPLAVVLCVVAVFLVYVLPWFLRPRK